MRHDKLKPDHRNWKQKFFKTIPMVGANGDPIPQDPPLNTEGFWKKPKTTSSILNEQIDKRRKNK